MMFYILKKSLPAYKNLNFNNVFYIIPDVLYLMSSLCIDSVERSKDKEKHCITKWVQTYDWFCILYEVMLSLSKK